MSVLANIRFVVLKYSDDIWQRYLRGERRPRRTFAATWRTWAVSSASGRAPRVTPGLAVAGTEADSTSSRVRPSAPEGGVSLGIALRGWILFVGVPLWGRGRRQPRDRRLPNPPCTCHLFAPAGATRRPATPVNVNFLNESDRRLCSVSDRPTCMIYTQNHICVRKKCIHYISC